MKYLLVIFIIILSFFFFTYKDSDNFIGKSSLSLKNIEEKSANLENITTKNKEFEVRKIEKSEKNNNINQSNTDDTSKDKVALKQQEPKMEDVGEHNEDGEQEAITVPTPMPLN